MKLPFVRRRTHETDLRAAAAGEAAAIKRANRAEWALASAFGVSVEDVFDSDVVEYRLRVAHIVLSRYRGDTKEMIRERLHEELDRMIRSPERRTA